MTASRANTTFLREVRCFLFDMDGTVYLGSRLLPGAADLLGELENRSVPFYFVTNNSSRSRVDYADKLTALGLSVIEEQIITSGEATAIYLQREHLGANVYLVGTPSLEAEFTRFGFTITDEAPDAVVLGLDTTLTYEKLVRLCDFVRAGLPYIATHPDINCPTEDGFIPDIGAIMALVEASTGRQPDVIIGKPYPPIAAVIAKKTGFAPSEIVMVGDRLYTDIALGAAGLRTVLVLTGETQPEDLVSAAYQPDLVVQDLSELHTLWQEMVELPKK
jgi:HAD superfamily hydrolase (TIGR01457 family)